jgi:hypothetical protein
MHTRVIVAAACAAISISGIARADAPRHWIYFADKGIAPEDLNGELARVERDYNPHALARREVRRVLPGLVDERDLPLHAGDLEAIRSLGLRIVHHSRWLNAVSVEGDAAALAGAALLPRVVSIEPCGRGCGKAAPRPRWQAMFRVLPLITAHRQHRFSRSG